MDKELEYHFFKWSELYNLNYDLELIFEAEKKIIEQSSSFTKKLLAEQHVNEILDAMPAPFEEAELFKGSPSYFISRFVDLESIRKRKIIETITQSNRKTSVLSIYSILEGQMKLLISLIENEFDFRIKIKDLDGRDYLHQTIAYLIKVFEIEYDKIEPLYTPLKQVKFIRNKIAHSNSQIDKSKIELIKKMNWLTSNELKGEHFIQIADEKFVLELLKNCSTFFNRLLSEVDKRYSDLKGV